MAGLPLVGDEFAGYRVRAVLGRGGMSVVYQAENLRLSNVIALKVLAPELASDDVFRTRFLEESRIAASLNHPNVIPIFDMGSQDDLLYIAMRYVSGTDMRQMIKKRGRILPATALFLIGQAARALDAAHRKGLVHRDVKPGNLLIERGSDDADPDHVYLADFGITKHAMSRSGLTSTGQFLGTIDYVAPEQIRGTSVMGLADQYSLGCVLYECLTGRVPFEKDLDAAIIWAHVEETPAMPTVLRPDLPPAIDDVESALAIFSEITRMRPACARRPDVAMLIERAKSLPSSAMILLPYASALSDSGFEQAETAAVERSGRGVIHLVGRDLQHLVFQIDRIAGRLGQKAILAAVSPETLPAPGDADMGGAGAHHAKRAHRTADIRALVVELRLDQVGRPEIRGIGVGDVFGQHALAFLVPLHFGAQRRQDRKIVDGHRAVPR